MIDVIFSIGGLFLIILRILLRGLASFGEFGKLGWMCLGLVGVSLVIGILGRGCFGVFGVIVRECGCGFVGFVDLVMFVLDLYHRMPIISPIS